MNLFNFFYIPKHVSDKISYVNNICISIFNIKRALFYKVLCLYNIIINILLNNTNPIVYYLINIMYVISVYIIIALQLLQDTYINLKQILLDNTSKKYILLSKKENKADKVGNYYYETMSNNRYYVNLLEYLLKSGAQVGITFFGLLKVICFPRPYQITQNQIKRQFSW